MRYFGQPLTLGYGVFNELLASVEMATFKLPNAGPLHCTDFRGLTQPTDNFAFLLHTAILEHDEAVRP